MKELTSEYSVNGYAIIDDIVESGVLSKVERFLELEKIQGVGTRNMLRLDWVQSLARSLRDDSALRMLLPNRAIAVQCTYFEKNVENNWYVTPHRDLSIPIKERFDSEVWKGWSEKEGVLFAQPPIKVLEGMSIVRIHFEDNSQENGALEVVPGSHLEPVINSEKVSCSIPKGGALVMKPLLLHSSSKLKFGSRRVLHFIFGPKELPDGAEWANAV